MIFYKSTKKLKKNSKLKSKAKIKQFSLEVKTKLLNLKYINF